MGSLNVSSRLLSCMLLQKQVSRVSVLRKGFFFTNLHKDTRYIVNVLYFDNSPMCAANKCLCSGSSGAAYFAGGHLPDSFIFLIYFKDLFTSLLKTSSKSCWVWLQLDSKKQTSCLGLVNNGKHRPVV